MSNDTEHKTIYLGMLKTIIGEVHFLRDKTHIYCIEPYTDLNNSIDVYEIDPTQSIDLNFSGFVQFMQANGTITLTNSLNDVFNET